MRGEGLTVTHHQGNKCKPNLSEMVPRTCQKGQEVRAGEAAGERGTLSSAGGMWTDGHWGKQHTVSPPKKLKTEPPYDPAIPRQHRRVHDGAIRRTQDEGTAICNNMDETRGP